MNNKVIYLHRHVLRKYLGCKDGHAVVSQIVVTMAGQRVN